MDYDVFTPPLIFNPSAKGDAKRGQGHVTLPSTLRTGLFVTAQVAVLIVAGWLVTLRKLSRVGVGFSKG